METLYRLTYLNADEGIKELTSLLLSLSSSQHFAETMTEKKYSLIVSQKSAVYKMCH